MLKTRIILIVVGLTVLLNVVVLAQSLYTGRAEAFAEAQRDQDHSLKSAAYILDASMPELAIERDGGDIGRLTSSALAAFEDNSIVDRIEEATGADATIFIRDTASGDFVRATTTIVKEDGTRAVGTPLGADNPVRAALARGEVFQGEATILGQDYLTVYHPIQAENGEVVGALFVGTDFDVYVSAVRDQAVSLILSTLVRVAILAVVLWFVLGWLLKGLDRLQLATKALASGDRDVGIPEQQRGDEIGQVARGLEALRHNIAAAEVAQVQAFDEAERARQNQSQMLGKLEREVAGVVQAVGQGDLSRTIQTHFEQPELQSLADAVNSLRDRIQSFISDIGDTLRAMADGDLTREMPRNYSGAFERIANDANETLDKLSAVLGDVVAAVEDTQAVVARIEKVSIDLGTRVEEQASALQETAATMEEMAASVRTNAASLSEAESAAVSARDTTKAGGSAASAAVEAVGRIADSSGQIAEILKVIDSIAFQTNLLALNAAVEAARAGDAGKGFAVVANEVGNLARQSSEAARDISALVTRNQSSVEEGVEMVRGAGDALRSIDDEIDRLSQRVTGVSLAGREQATGIQEVNRAVSSLDQMTQENAGLTESAASEVNTVNREMSRLLMTVSRLRIKGAQAGGGRWAA